MRWVLVVSLAGCSFRGLTGDAAVGGVDGDDIVADAANRPIDGSPDVDSDRDGINDAIDNCILISNYDQRDWDNDGHGDPCDLCPHLASSADPDGDGDGVGDACDPRPALPGDQRVMWSGFYDALDITGWPALAGTWSVAGGVLTQSDPATGFTTLDTPSGYADLYFATSIDVVQLGIGGEIGVCGGHIPGAIQYYCCAVYNDGSPGVRAVSAWSTSGGQQIDATAWPGSLAAGARVDVVGTMGTSSVCDFTQGSAAVTRRTTKGTVDGAAVFYLTYAAASFRYLFAVQIGS